MNVNIIGVFFFFFVDMKRNKREERISADFLKDVMKEIKMKKT